MKTHRFDSLSFLAGLVITLIGLAFLLLPEVGDIVDFFTSAGAWFWPMVFIAAGLAVLAPMASLTREPSDAPTADDDEGDEGDVA